MPTREDKRGALWQKSSAKGDYFTGVVVIEGVEESIVIFPNQFKDNDKQPDWIIYKSQPLPQGGRRGNG